MQIVGQFNEENELDWKKKSIERQRLYKSELNDLKIGCRVWGLGRVVSNR